MADALYRNPRVRVRRSPMVPTVRGDTADYPGETAWSIWLDGRRLPAMVVRTRHGTTVTDGSGRMVTCWHAGVSAGDLARLQFNLHPENFT